MQLLENHSIKWEYLHKVYWIYIFFRNTWSNKLFFPVIFMAESKVKMIDDFIYLIQF